MPSKCILALAAVAVLAAACVAPDKTPHTDLPKVKPSLILKPPSVPPEGAATTLDAVLEAPSVVAYTVGRTIDPSDPGLMHEAHIVYRREADAAWRLQAGGQPQTALSPAGQGKAAPASEPVRLQEIDGVLGELRRASEENRRAIALLFQAVENLARVRAAAAAAPSQAESARGKD